jgi:hypothetical protein
MSAAGATTAPLRRVAGAGASPLPSPRQPAPSGPARSRAQLSIVASRPAAAGRAPFAVLIAGILLAGLMGLLLVHTLAAQDAFRVHDLNQRLASLKDSEQRLQIATEQAESPNALRTRALALGMRPSQIDGYRHAKDGRVIGTLTAIPLPVIAPVPTPTATTKHHAKGKAGSKPTTKSTKAGTTSTKAAAKPGATSKKAATTAAPHAGHHAARRTGASHH